MTRIHSEAIPGIPDYEISLISKYDRMAIVSRATALLDDEVSTPLLKQLLTFGSENQDKWTNDAYRHRNDIAERIIQLLRHQRKFLEFSRDKTAGFMSSFTKDFSDSDWEVIVNTCKKRVEQTDVIPAVLERRKIAVKNEDAFSRSDAGRYVGNRM